MRLCERKETYAVSNEAHDAREMEGKQREDEKRSLRRALGQFATGVTVITTRVGDKLAGATVNSFSSVSLEPPLVLWSLAKTSQSFSVFEEATHCAVNVLNAEQMAISNRFARSGGDKFTDLPIREGINGTPILNDCAAVMECEVVARHEGGDHVIIVAKVLRHSHEERPLLLFAKGRYGLAADYPDQPMKLALVSSDNAPREMMIRLMRNALHHFSSAFQQDREAEGLTINQGRALIALERVPDASTEQVARLAFLSFEEADYTLTNLAERGLAVRSPTGKTQLSELGKQRLDGLRARAAAFEARQFANIPPEELAIVRNFMMQLVANNERQ
jgi:flavin reductase (DIM6/NTAB) family NADH-FMN oxidoreductase RutF/DNA-binding MarR family transcriptional regulator